MTNLDSILKSKDNTLPAKVCLVKAMVFSVVMYGCELDCKESWEPKNWCFWTVVLEKTLESPLDCKNIQPVHPKGDQSCVFIGRPDFEAETTILWPPHVKIWLIWKKPDAGKDWGQEEKGTTGWDGWMASPTQWTWVWVDSGSWWWTGRPGVLQSMGWHRVGHDWATELNWTEKLCLLLVVEGFSAKSCWVAWTSGSQLRGQVNMEDEAKCCSSICSTFEVFVVEHEVKHCCRKELGPFCWQMQVAAIAVFSISHWFAEHTSQI